MSRLLNIIKPGKLFRYYRIYRDYEQRTRREHPDIKAGSILCWELGSDRLKECREYARHEAGYITSPGFVPISLMTIAGGFGLGYLGKEASDFLYSPETANALKTGLNVLFCAPMSLVGGVVGFVGGLELSGKLEDYLTEREIRKSEIKESKRKK